MFPSLFLFLCVCLGGGGVSYPSKNPEVLNTPDYDESVMKHVEAQISLDE